jgi:TetR/AcrR family transcriptional regulator
MKTKDIPKTKLKILEAAEKLFAEKGFDGARVDDIAENAGVNKALIYYYFRSKREILEELFNTLIEELLELTLDMVGNGSLDFESIESMQVQMQSFYGFMESRKDTIRIMMMESLKSSREKPPLFRFSEIAMSEEIISTWMKRSLLISSQE